MSRWALPLRRVARLGAARRVRSRAALSTKDSSETETTPSPSLKERMKETVKLYGLTATVFHSSVYVLSLGATFAAVRSGLDTGELLRSWGLGDHVDMIPPEAGDLAAAWCICAVTGPARGVLTVTASPIIARYMKLRGSKKENESGNGGGGKKA